MESCFINYSNHPSADWPEVQRRAAEAFGPVVDVAFPSVSPDGDHEYILALADEQEAEILSRHPAAVMCQGEFCLSYEMIRRLKAAGITVLAACTERKVVQDGNRKTAVFEFRRFREF